MVAGVQTVSLAIRGNLRRKRPVLNRGASAGHVTSADDQPRASGADVSGVHRLNGRQQVPLLDVGK